MNVKKSCKSALSLVLALVMLVGLVPWSVVAEAAAVETTYVLAGGDFQEYANGESGNHVSSSENVSDILATVTGAGYTEMDGFIFVGDYDCETHDSSTETSTGIDALMSSVQASYSNLTHDNSILIQGNHDTLEPEIDATGAHEFDAYSVFVMNCDDYPDEGGTETQIESLANSLKSWLYEKALSGYSKPIFVASHLPLAFGPRTNVKGDGIYAKYIFDVLNAAGTSGLNIIFMHGHNHAYGYDEYLGGEAIYLEKGDSINIAEVGSRTSYTTETLNFTYMNAGYVGYYNETTYTNGTNIGTDKLTMTVFAITGDEVKVERYSADGLYNLKSAGELAGAYIDNVNVEADTTVYASPQTIELMTPPTIDTVDEATGIRITSSFDSATLGLTVTAGVTVAALEDTTLYSAYEAYTIDTAIDVSGNPAYIYIPVPTEYPLGATGVYYVNTDGTLKELATNVTMIDGQKVAVVVATEAGTYAVVNESAALEEDTEAAPEASVGNWVGVETDGSYTYVLDTDGIEYGVNDRYIIVASNTSRMLTANGTSTSRETVTISGNTVTLTSRDDEWYFINDSSITGSTTYNTLITQTGNTWLYHTDSSMYVDNNDISHRGYWQVYNRGNGQYSFYDYDNYNWYLYYSSSKFTVTNSDTNASVRLFKYQVNPNQYAMLEGPAVFEVPLTTIEANTLAQLKAAAVAYLADDTNGTNKTDISDGLEWTWIDTYDGDTPGYYTIQASYMGQVIGTVEVAVSAVPEDTVGNWVGVETDGSYTYVLDTDGIEYGVSDRYIIVASGTNQMLTANGTGTSNETVTISGSTVTLTSRDDEWYFINDSSITGSTTYNTLITQTGNTWLYHTDSSMYVNNNDISHRGYWQVYNRGNGEYSFYDIDNNINWYLYYGSSNFTVTRYDTSASVRLYKYQANPNQYAMLEGPAVFEVPLTTIEANALAQLKAAAVAYLADDTNGTNKTDISDGLEWTWIDTYDGDTAGYYTIQASYKGQVLGTVEVCVAKKVVSTYDIVSYDGTTATDVSVAYVGQNASQLAQVFDANEVPVYVRVCYTDGTYSYVPLTVGMLGNSEVMLSTKNITTYEGLAVNYNSFNLTNIFTLHVIASEAGNDYPEYPDGGSVTIDKTADASKLQSTGTVQVELSTAGVPTKVGIDVVVVVDTSSSMSRNEVGTTGYTRLEVLQDSMEDMIDYFNTPDSNGKVSDIDIAIVDFNGYGTEYANLIGSLPEWGFTAYPTVYTGNGQFGSAGAFVSAQELLNFDVAANINQTYSGTNYDGGLANAYLLLEAKAIQNESVGETRDRYVIFLSDGAPFGWNGIVECDEGGTSNGGATNGTSYYWWNQYLAGNYDDLNDMNTDAQASTTHPATINTQYQFLNTTANGKNPNRWAEAIKGDTETFYKVLGRIDHATAEPSDLMNKQGLGAKIYSIGFGIAEDGRSSGDNYGAVTVDTMTEVLNTLATDPGSSNVQYCYPDVQTSEELSAAFQQIVTGIRYAATDAYFVDQMGDSFDLQLASVINTIDDNGVESTLTLNPAPQITVTLHDVYTAEQVDTVVNGVTVTEAMVGERTGTSTVIETVTFNTQGTEAYSDLINSSATNILVDGVITAKNFWYNTNSAPVNITLGDGSVYSLPAETFYWNIGIITEKEIALSYTVYLEGSMQGNSPAGSYSTNNFATLYYVNWLGNDAHKDTVSPSVGWETANVSYAFYLVDKNGNPVVNQTTGDTGSFYNAVKVTSPVVFQEILLNNLDTINTIEASSLQVLPAGYTLYDSSATYKVTILSYDGRGSWQITADPGLKQSTYVTGHYGSIASNDLFATTHNDYVGEDVYHDEYDYTHTTVWFALVWEPQTINDVIVVDYGLPVNISVLENDMFGENGSLAGVGQKGKKPTTAGNNFTAELDADFTSATTSTFGSATVNGDKVNYVINTTNGMQFNDVDRLEYAVYYDSETEPGYYYGDIMVLPATMVYYEENFITFTDSTAATATAGAWAMDGQRDESAHQAEDRPGYYSLPEIDADNVYGYDKAYSSCATFSNGGAMKVTVDSATGSKKTAPVATFTFTGTGFDIISLTDSDSGLITVTAVGTNEANFYRQSVNNYYGYVYNEETGEWVVTKTEDTLWQVPVLKFEDMAYDTYTVTVTVAYTVAADMLADSSYSFWLDAVRIYDPAPEDTVVTTTTTEKDGETVTTTHTINQIYAADKENNPDFMVVKDIVLSSDNLTEDGLINGAVFIDGLKAGATYGGTSNTDLYETPGPNNETYLAYGQSIAFKLVATSQPVAVELGAKLAEGETATVLLKTTGNTSRSRTFTTATEMYYTLPLIWQLDETEGSETYGQYVAEVSLTNTTGSLVSLTNLKLVNAEFVEAEAASETETAANSLARSGSDVAQVSVVVDSAYAKQVAVDTVKNYAADTLYDTGDINGDGKVNAIDANLMKRFITGVNDATIVESIAADLTEDGNVNSLDANLLARTVAGK